MLHQRLLGQMDLDTREWFDGVLTAAARKVVKEPPEVSMVRLDYRPLVVCTGSVRGFVPSIYHPL